MSTNLSAAFLLGLGLGVGGYWLYEHPSALEAFIQNMAGPPPVLVPHSGYPICSVGIHRNCVIDGDTFYLAADKVRIADIDAPEIHPARCASEDRLGRRATQRLSELLSAGAFKLVSTDRDLDKYGRKLRLVMRNDRSIGDILVREGLARNSLNGHRDPWCSAVVGT